MKRCPHLLRWTVEWDRRRETRQEFLHRATKALRTFANAYDADSAMVEDAKRYVRIKSTATAKRSTKSRDEREAKRAEVKRLLNMGMNPSDIAKALGCSRSHVYHLKRLSELLD